MKRHSVIILLVCTLLCATAAPALAWETPVIGEPSDWSYQDEQRSIAIWRVQVGDAVCFIADVQLAGVALFRTELDAGMSPVSKLAQRAGAVLAINGDDYGTHKYGVIIPCS